ncbi:MAG TPA: GNAT family N-acetyltransferase, partial [bacterium]|nr:GNAT family N-acetyltransferase [bacterium]
PMVVKFHETLSDHSVYLRYFQPLQLSQRVAHERLIRICFTDYEREMALIALRKKPTGDQEVLGICRLSSTRLREEAEYSILVSDQLQGQGLGSRMMKALLDIAKAEGIKRVVGYILPENSRMQAVSTRLGFKLNTLKDIGVVQAWIDL